MTLEKSGLLHGLAHTYQGKEQPVDYYLHLNEEKISLNEWIGQQISIQYDGQKNCIACGRKTNKTFNSGYCYPCFTKRPENDLCIVKPHECHFDQGTCRDESFGESHCMIPHYVYLALSSDVKVGLTRKNNELKRWVDQGAVRAIPIAELPTRRMAGELEVHLSQFMPDKTNWRKMLKGEVKEADLIQLREEAYEKFPEEFKPFQLREDEWIDITYPILETLSKINSLSLDKLECVSGKLLGVKGQYLIMDIGVFQVRKHAGYHVTVKTG
ncbi:DUF2797 domain-containing protein [Brevibacillus laterosporus]|uniref:DUF2797 domain-containing protein n=1 Tax=Brevibacillus TaxID=55080 RepID=UPI000BDABF0B|nr:MULTISPECIES: DUF2797 domain-containing protein [Brevibacillus]AUM66793.1 DUF2797 domain-containing protein [Brevibacillus laterosporus]MCR8964270.1 DUF2797 domain-containing protein [Brevibacillus laterosporus]MCR8995929.1 DUF2797 domain-containing protein [Brevibacillus laterosporus]MCZ0836425.1 DUF2797 domain-containing protein [Brevibacillus halotolerans]PCN44256.1 hypothetical protein B9C88_10725 [Brevibacillus laterosporus]